MIQIVPGDNLVTLPALAARSVQCIITSPPYYGLRDYQIPPSNWPAISYAPLAGLPLIEIPAMDCCLGLEPTIEAYIGHLVHVWRLLWRVLRDDGTCWLNIGDAYANDKKWGGATSGKHVRALHGNSGVGRRRHTTGLPSKSLMLIPQRLALALQADGWTVRSEVIWHKPDVQPENVADRLTRDHEQIWMLTKQPQYRFDAAAIAVPCAPATAQRLAQTTLDQQTGGAKAAIYPQQTLGRNSRSRRPAAILQGLRDSGKTTRNRRSVWTIPVARFGGAHFATFPEDLVRPCLLAGTRANDVVLDPYGGSGTVGRVAVAHQRAAILCEINESYLDMQRSRTDRVQIHMEVV